MTANDITRPLRLAVGSHEAGSGRGCAMNVVSWENGDAVITDLPPCSDPMLARVVQRVNDTYCTHRDGDLLCAPCSVVVLDLAHRTVGTALVGWSEDAQRRVWVRLALDEAESVARPDEDASVTRCREVVAGWLDGTATRMQVANAASAAATSYAAASAAATSYAATYAAYTIHYDATEAAANAANAASAAATSYAAADRLGRAHRLIDRFEALTGVSAPPVPAETARAAVAAMTGATA